MTTLVFGGTGFIGRRTIPRLVQAGEQVVVMDLNPASADYSALGDAVRVTSGNITSFEDVIKAVMDAKPDRIMNLAYLLGSGEDTPHFSLGINILGMDNCFDAARLCGVNRVTYASSIAVSGLQTNFGDRMTNEDDAQYGTRQYAKHKMFNEYQAAPVQPHLRHEHYRHSTVERHGLRQGPRFHRPRPVHHAAGRGAARQLPAQGHNPPAPARRRARGDLHPRHPRRLQSARGLQQRRHPPSASARSRTSCGSSSPTPRSPSTMREVWRTPTTTS